MNGGAGAAGFPPWDAHAALPFDGLFIRPLALPASAAVCPLSSAAGGGPLAIVALGYLACRAATSWPSSTASAS